MEQSTQYSENLKKIVYTKTGFAKNTKAKKDNSADSNNNIDFLGFSCNEINASKESYERCLEANSLVVRHKIYRRIDLKAMSRKSLSKREHHRKSNRRKDTVAQSIYFKNEENHSVYFTKQSNYVDIGPLSIKEEKRDVKLEKCHHIKPDPDSGLIETEPEMLDYESEYFNVLKTNTIIKTEHQWLLREDCIPDEKPITWIPPRSPHNLIEEVLHQDPWALLVATIFLNRTRCMCARPYIFWFLTENPGPLEVLEKHPKDLEKYFFTLGLQRTRAVQVWRMSHDFVYKKCRNVKDLYGIGEYGEDAFRMFCQGDFSVAPRDRFLRIYKAWYEKILLGQEKGEMVQRLGS